MSGQDEPEARTGLEVRSKAAFDASLDDLSANVRSRLTQARFAAVAELEHGRRSPWQRFLAPAAGLLATALLVAIVVAPIIRPSDQLADQPATRLADDDIPILLDTDNIEMLEDMEFYAWLDDDALGDETAAPATVQPVEPARS